MVTHGQSFQRLEYFGLIERDGRIAEVLVVRERGRQVSQTATGVTYPTVRQAVADNERKNRLKAGAR